MLTDKKIGKIQDILGEHIQELDAMSEDEVKTRIVVAAGAIEQAKNELDANPIYMQIREDLKNLSAGMKEVRKRQNAVVQYCLHILESRGQQ